MSAGAPTPRPVWQKTLLLALAYFIVARAIRLLAIPPGYATIVWPSAGLAVGALWIWGLELWPGVLIGSFAGNVVNPNGSPVPAPVALAAWIALGATAQAVVAVLSARRSLQERDPLREETDLFRFLLLCGPLACLVAATWAIAGMRCLGAIGPHETAFAWSTWWAGDSIGVAVGAPLLLLWFTPRKAGSRRGRLPVTVVLLSTLVGIALIHLYALRAEEDRVRASARQKLADVTETLRVGISGHLDALQSTADYFASAPAVTRAEFRQFARGLLARHPGMKALEWRPRVLHAQRASVEEAARRDGLKGFVFTGLSSRGDLVKRAAAPEYFPILYAEPVKGNERALGLDLGQQQSPVHDAAEKALAGGQPAASGGFTLVQEAGTQVSVAVMVPVRAADGVRVTGLVEGVYRIGAMMEALLAGVDSRTLGVHVYDDTPPGPPQLLYARAARIGTPLEPLQMVGNFAGRRWLVELIPSSDFQTRARSALSWFSVAVAFGFSYLIAWVVLTLYGRGERVAALVAQQTEELREQERRLMRAQRLESVGRLAGGIAHEFNNILMGASGLAQIVLQSLGPKHASSPDLEGIIASIKHAGHLVSQLLTFSRHREASRKILDINDLVSHLLKMMAVAVGRRIELVADIPGAPLWIMADPGQVEQVLLNLCFNARDALKGKGTIRLSTRAVRLDRELDAFALPVKPGRYAVLEVADEGPGMTPDVLSRVFEPFFTTKPFGEGTGLGLSVVAGIIREHGGGLDIQTTPGKGTAMLVYWPACDAPSRAETPPSMSAAPRGSGHILIVDDEPVMRPVLARILTGYGYTCVCAAGGAEALEILARTPDIRGVVLDLVMPGMDGVEAYHHMIALRPDLKVLFISGFAPRQLEQEISRLGLPFLAKPADAARLATALHDALRDRPAA